MFADRVEKRSALLSKNLLEAMSLANPTMQYRFLGRSGLQVSAISLGGWLTYGNLVERGKQCESVSIATSSA